MAKTDPEIKTMRTITAAMEAVAPEWRAKMATILTETPFEVRSALAEVIGAVSKLAESSATDAARVIGWVTSKYGG